MDLRRLVRGTVEWDQLEGLCRELARRLDESELHVTFIETDNWSSIPFVVNEDYFVKVITPQNALVHALFTGARNLGAFTSGSQGFFDRFEDPHEMARHEMVAIRRIRSIGLNAPEPVDVFEYDPFGVVVMEYLPDFRTLEAIGLAERPDLQHGLFEALATMHDHGVVHGDLRADNVIVYDDALYFIDATLVNDDWAEQAKGYDLASAIAITTPVIGAKRTVSVAREHFTAEALLNARAFLGFVRLRPDHDFDQVQLRGEIESHLG